jgi:tRNA pseudouridine38-40 synthase
VDSSLLKTIKLTVAYDGTRFKGWQRGNGRTVQGVLEDALSRALGTASSGAVRSPIETPVVGAGRTDAGVHAEGQVASVRVPASVSAALLLPAVNALLPDDLSVSAAEDAAERFHARYNAVAKTYRYRVVDGPVPNPFLHRYAWRVPAALDDGAMEAAAEAFLGERDFSAFTADKGKKDKVRRVDSVRIVRSSLFGSPVLELDFRGDGFLWNQVRIMASALVAAGKGELGAEDLRRLLETLDRSLSPAPAPACGLTLVNVEYPHG